MPSSTSALTTLEGEVRKDRRVLRRMQHLLADRAAQVRALQLDGVVATEFPDFAGVRALRGALDLSITHMDYSLEAIRAQLDLDENNVVPLEAKE